MRLKKRTKPSSLRTKTKSELGTRGKASQLVAGTLFYLYGMYWGRTKLWAEEQKAR